MTTEERVEFYKLVDEFMRHEIPTATEHEPEWNDIMPVINHIDKCYSLMKQGPSKEYDEQYLIVEHALTNEYDLEEIVPAIIRFIEWFNKQEKRDRTR